MSVNARCVASISLGHGLHRGRDPGCLSAVSSGKIVQCSPNNLGLRLKEAQIKPNMVERSELGAAWAKVHVPLPSVVHPSSFNVAVDLIAVALLARCGQPALMIATAA
tara:strand:- start:4980 stop:5303 length:324 start_codon:yes stop_codon:yes gene_type:complete